LSTDYAERLKRMQDRLDIEVKKNTVVKDAIKIPRPKPKHVDSIEEKTAKEYEAKLKLTNQSIDMDLFPEKEEKKK
jgi:hypothetical protein